MRDISNFKEDLKFGKIGEDACERCICSRNTTKQCINVSDIKFFQDRDIDFVQITQDNISLDNVIKYMTEHPREKIPFANTFEAKTDTKGLETGNFYLEISSGKQMGFGLKSMADFWYIVFVDKNNIIQETYILNRKELLNDIFKHTVEIINRDCIYLINGKEVKDYRGYIRQYYYQNTYQGSEGKINYNIYFYLPYLIEKKIAFKLKQNFQ